MKLLRSTVAVKDSLTEEVLKKILLSASHCLSDLDHTDVDGSPAIDVAKKRIGVSSTSFGHLKLVSWAFWTGLEFSSAFSSEDRETAMETVRERRFSAYDRTVLRNPMAPNYQRELKSKVKQELAKLVNERYIARSLFRGVKEFYQVLPAKKIYLSRNLQPIVEAYAGFLGFTDALSEVKQKQAALERLLLSDHSMRRLIFRIDGVAENEMINTAKFYLRQKWSPVEGVLILKRSLEMNDDFRTCDVVIGSNDYGLVDIMKERR
ncbi:hypothetical protein J4421_05395 [Candidatus Woesearchaeota archaeon]|nr:hypothetical protein [Candidatus Woesearchaeota archaeon]